MNTLRRSARHLALALGALLALALPAGAQGPTPEGTVLTSSTSASWTDANGNTYTPVTATVSVTVGFVAGLDLTVSDATVTPASPSTGNSVTLTVTNVGNGIDTLDLLDVQASAGLTITGYEVNGTPYAPGAYEAAATAISLAAGATLTLEVIYDVADVQGGESLSLTFDAQSRRDGTVTESAVITIEPPMNIVFELGSTTAAADRLPSNGTSYTAEFTLTSTGNINEIYDLDVASSDPSVTIVSINGDVGTTSPLTVSGGEQETFLVVYTVGDVAAGTAATLTVTAASRLNAGITDAATHAVAVIRAGLSIDKAIYADDLGSPSASPMDPEETVEPGEFFWYRVAVTNDGAAPADGISLTETLPEDVLYLTATGDGGSPAWSLSHSGDPTGGVVTATLSAPLASGATRYFWVRVQVID